MIYATKPYTISKDGEKLVKKDLDKQFTGKPFRIFWESQKADEGEYMLQIEGYFLNDFSSIHYPSILFYHKEIQ